ncbi:MAG TPA: SxtJ family membrane protein [Candidatus Berkiella sp.]|nr:SxtJ family membrane protein [Candidatus Berkiella sp.]
MNVENLTIPELRKFGLTLASVFIGAFGLLLPLLMHKPIPSWPWIIGIVVLIPTMTKPVWLKAIYHPWMKVGHLLGWINTRIILGIIFFLLITPIGLIRRALGKDSLGLQFDKELKTYRKQVTAQSIQHMEKPF